MLAELIELMLREVSHLQILRSDHAAGQRRETAGKQLQQRRFAIPIGAKNRHAVVVVDAQRDSAQHRTGGLITDANVVESDNGRGQWPGRRGNLDGPHLVDGYRGAGLQLGQQLKP